MYREWRDRDVEHETDRNTHREELECDMSHSPTQGVFSVRSCQVLNSACQRKVSEKPKGGCGGLSDVKKTTYLWMQYQPCFQIDSIRLRL